MNSQTIDENESLSPAAEAVPALDSLQQQLYAAKMAEETVAFIMGKITAQITENVIAKVQEILGEEDLKSLESLPSDQEREVLLNELLLKKSGQSLTDMREQVTEQLVKEFEAA
jgi:hypothetical protein